MRFLVWAWRVVAVIVLGTFVATVYYVTHERFTDVSGMDGVLPALNLVTVIGVGLLGVVWTLARRYWHALFLLASLGVVRGLLGDELLTEFQNFWLFISIGVVGLVFVVSLTARALANERKLKSVATWSTAQPQFRPSPAPEVITPSVVTVPLVEEPATTEPASQPDPGKKGSKDS